MNGKIHKKTISNSNLLNGNALGKFKDSKKMTCPIELKELKSMMDIIHAKLFVVPIDPNLDSEDYNQENEDYIKNYKEKKAQIDRESKERSRDIDSDSEIELEKKKLEKKNKKRKLEELKSGKRKKTKKNEIQQNPDVQSIERSEIKEIRNTLSIEEIESNDSIIRQKRKISKTGRDILTEKQNEDLENRLPDQQNYYKLNDEEQKFELLKSKFEDDNNFNQLMKSMGIDSVDDLTPDQSRKEAFMALIEMESERSPLSIVWTFLSQFGRNSNNRNASEKIPDIPIRTRKHEEAYLREAFPNANERLCIKGDKCEGRFIPKSTPITNVEFVSLEDQVKFMINEDDRPKIPSACVMCQRKTIQYYWICARGASASEGIKYDIIIQHYRNIVGEQGEYIQDDCFKSSSDNKGMPFPVALHIRSNYNQVEKIDSNGNKTFWWEQTGYTSVYDYDENGADQVYSNPTISPFYKPLQNRSIPQFIPVEKFRKTLDETSKVDVDADTDVDTDVDADTTETSKVDTDTDTEQENENEKEEDEPTVTGPYSNIDITTSPFLPNIYLDKKKVSKIRNMPMYNRKLHTEIIHDYFKDNTIIPEWFYNISNVTEETSIQGTEYENPFAANLTVIEKGLLDCKSFYRNDYKQKEFVWCPLGISNGLKGYSIYYNTVNMLDYIEEVIRKLPKLPLEIIKSLRNIQDRFQCLSLFMESKTLFKDEELLFKKKNSIELRPIEFYGPRMGVTFDLCYLPDLTIHVSCCKFCGNSDESPFDDDNSRIIINLLNKSLPYACKSRSLRTILPYSWKNKPKLTPEEEAQEAEAKEKKEQSKNGKKPKKKRKGTIRTKHLIHSTSYNRSSTSNRKNENFEGFFEIINRFTLASLLGIYDHCKIVANFQVRRKIYKNFILNTTNRSLFEKWVNDNGKLCTYIIREYLYYCTKNLPGIEEYMKENYFWDIMQDNTFQAMDSIRNFMNQSLNSYMYLHDRFIINDLHLNGVFEHYDEESIHFNHFEKQEFSELFESQQPWHKEMINILAKFNKDNLVRAPRTMEVSFIDKVFDVTRALNDGRFLNEMERYDEILPIEIRKVIENMIEVWHQMGELYKLHFDWLILQPIGLTPAAAIELVKVQNLYEMEESRSKINLTMLEIHRKRSYDYFVLHYFFQTFKDRKSIMIYKLPADMQRKILNTFHKLYETRSGEELPYSAGLSLSLSLFLSLTISIGIYYYCKACKELKTNVYEYDENHNKRRYSSYCSVGVCVDIITGKKTCAKISSKSNPKNRDTSTDTLKDVLYDKKKEEKKLKKEARRERKMTMINECPKTELIEIDMKKVMYNSEAGCFLLCPWCVKMTEMSKKSFNNPLGEFSCGCLKYDYQEKIICKICGRKCKEPSYFNVYDDSDEFDQGVRSLAFCTHHNLGKFLNDWGQILSLSTIKESIKRGWKSFVLNDGGRIFTESNFNWNRRRRRSFNDEEEKLETSHLMDFQ